MSTDPGMALHRDARKPCALRWRGDRDVAAQLHGGPSCGWATHQRAYDALAQRIDEASYRVTDADVDAVRQATGSDKATFEIVMSACIGAGLARWDAAARAIEEATDAST